ncbi:hypothetical protein ABFS83_13G155700 [Erythranthe nasuta]
MASSSLVQKQKLVFLVLIIGLLFSFGNANWYGTGMTNLGNPDSIDPNGNVINPLKKCGFDKMYLLGGSLSDTGNLISETVGSTLPFGKQPYSHGRSSNGLLITDNFAYEAGINPIPDPYKDLNFYFNKGVNFAVAGSTALPTEVLATKYMISSPVTNSSLDVQLDWMSDYFSSTTCLTDNGCTDRYNKAIFFVGEIGGSDYQYAILQGKLTMDQLTDMVPDVVAAVINATKKVLNLGARRVVIPGIFPLGCLPIYKTLFQSNVSTNYDEHQCLNQLNDLARSHNEQLQEGINSLMRENPNAVLVYGDYYQAYKHLHRIATLNDFDTEKACCGIGGDYNFNITTMCGHGGFNNFMGRNRYISWDGINLTRIGNKIMANWLIRKTVPKLQCQS